MCMVKKIANSIAIIMKNYVTSAVLEEAPCTCFKWFINDKLSIHIQGVLVVKLNTSKGIFIAFHKSIPTSLLCELASMKAGDKIDIFFRFEHLEGGEQVKCFYDVKIHEGDIMRFKHQIWHERMPVIADYLPRGEDIPIEKIPTISPSSPSYFFGFLLLSFIAILPVCGYLSTSFLIKMLVP